MNDRERLKDKKRIVIKIGSSSLTHAETGKLNLRKLEILVRELGDLRNHLDIACDALPQEVVEAAPLSFASIKYHREVPMGQTVQVFYAPSGNGWYVLGRREEHAAFECYLEFGSSVTESLQK